MFQIQFHDDSTNQTKTLKFKTEENSGGGDCLFKTIHSFLNRNKSKLKYSGNDHLDLRKSISNFSLDRIEEVKFNLENHIPFYSTLNLEEVHLNNNLHIQSITEYEEHMSKIGNYGTIFELNIAAKLYGFVGVVFIEEGSKFVCFNFGYTDDYDKDSLKPKLFVLFTGPKHLGHFRALRPITIASIKLANIIPTGDYSVIQNNTEPDKEFTLIRALINHHFQLFENLPCSQCDFVDSKSMKISTRSMTTKVNLRPNSLRIQLLLILGNSCL